MVAPFANRTEAGRLLAAELRKYTSQPDVVVLGLPRGGVPVAFAVASALHAPLDVLSVRKLGMPGQKELAIGAIAPGSVRVLHKALIKSARIPAAAIEQIAAEQKRMMDRAERLYRAGRPAPRLRGRTVIVVDDGIATGATMHAALKAVKQQQAKSVIAAVPVASVEAWEVLAGEADEVICLATPEPFYSVGLWYEEFPQVTDDEVRGMLAQSAPPKVA
jgi:putative phosphoribosyl transferase